MTLDTHTLCLAFSSGTIITCFNDLGLSRPGIEPDLPHARRTLYQKATAAFKYFWYNKNMRVEMTTYIVFVHVLSIHLLKKSLLNYF